MPDVVTAEFHRPFNMTQFLFGGSSQYGDFSHTNAYEKVSWVYAAANKTASTVSMTPAEFCFKETDEPIPPEHPVYQQFHPPYGFQIPSISDLLKTSVLHRELFGEFFWVFDDQGNVRTIFPAFMQPLFRPGTSEVVGWEFFDGTNRRRFRLEDVLFYKYPHPFDPVRGFPPLSAARWAIEQDVSMVAWNAKNFKSGVRPKIVVTAKTGVSSKMRKEIREEIKQNNQGLPGDEVMIIGGDVEVETVAQNLRDLEFLQGREMSREEILSVLDVPPALVGVFRFANYANARFQGQHFYYFKIVPYLQEIEQIVTMQLEIRGFSDVKFKFDNSKIIDLFVPLRDRIETFEKMIKSGIPQAAALDAAQITLDPDLMSGAESGNPGQPAAPGTSGSSSLRPSNEPNNPRPSPSPRPPALEAPKGDITPLRASGYAWDLLEARLSRPMKAYLDRFKAEVIKDIRRDVELLFIENEMWKNIFIDTIESHVQDEVFAGWNVVQAELGRKGHPSLQDIVKAPIDTMFDIPSLPSDIVDELRPTVRQLAGSFSSVTYSMGNEIERRVSAGLAKGASLADIENDISEFFESPRWNRVITRQVVGGAYNTGRYIGMSREGISSHKWQSMADDRVRPSHNLESGNIVPIGQPFPFTRLRFPHDPIGPASQIYGCRCITVPVGDPRTNRSESLIGWFTKGNILRSFVDTIKNAFDKFRVRGWKKSADLDQGRTAAIGSQFRDYFDDLLRESDNAVITISDDLTQAATSAGANAGKIRDNIQRSLSRLTPQPTDIEIKINPTLGFRSTDREIFVPQSALPDFITVYSKGKYDAKNDPLNLNGAMAFQLGEILERKSKKSLIPFRDKRIDRSVKLPASIVTGVPNSILDVDVFDSTLPHPLMGAVREDGITNITPMLYTVIATSLASDKDVRTLGEWFLMDPETIDTMVETIWEIDE